MTVLRVEPAGAVTLLELNRPEVRNALSSELLDELLAALGSIATDDGCGCVVLAGAGPSFCAGADLRELAGQDAAAFAAYLDRYRLLGEAIHGLGRPVIAAVHGHAIAGGFELACMCHLRVVAEDARLRVGDLDVGLSPTSGLTWTLPRLVGAGRARWLMLAGPTVGGDEAVRIGLAEETVPADRLREHALCLAARIAALPGVGVARTLALLDLGTTSTYDESVAVELVAEAETFAHPETKAAIAAFLDRGRSCRGDTTLDG